MKYVIALLILSALVIFFVMKYGKTAPPKAVIAGTVDKTKESVIKKSVQ